MEESGRTIRFQMSLLTSFSLCASNVCAGPAADPGTGTTAGESSLILRGRKYRLWLLDSMSLCAFAPVSVPSRSLSLSILSSDGFVSHHASAVVFVVECRDRGRMDDRGDRGRYERCVTPSSSAPPP
jgi:hypothetical protein